MKYFGGYILSKVDLRITKCASSCMAMTKMYVGVLQVQVNNHDYYHVIRTH